MKALSPQKIEKFRENVWAFYQTKKRNLPWRETEDPYKILVSEIMLQQTQVDRVISFYRAWMKRWPAIQDLSKASRREVLKQWIGLGYNNRAIRLHETAKKIVACYEGDVIKALQQEKLPGIGPYTAHAVCIFSRNEDITAIDTNIRRLLIHELDLPEKSSVEMLEAAAAQCLPRGRSRDWHNALMDYGALQQTSRKTGIKPFSKQSTFKGSDREIRAKILRHLVTVQYASLTTIQHLAGTDTLRLKKILKSLEKEGIILNEKNSYALNEVKTSS